MTVDDALEFSQKEIGGEQANIDSRYLVSYVLNKDFTWIKTWGDAPFTNDQENLLSRLIKRRQKGEPIAYITGEKEFWSLTLETNPSTLIPRPETELLVEKALDYLSGKVNAKVLDLGTGTGAIALSIASERINDEIIASDYIQEAVQLANRNASRNKIENVTIIQSNWFSNVKEADFDLIVSNPPYVEENDPHLNQGDLRFEPSSALTSVDNGLADIKVIIDESKQRLVQGGMLMIEHGFEQGKTVRDIYLKRGFSQVETVKDLSDLDRITVGIN